MRNMIERVTQALNAAAEKFPEGDTALAHALAQAAIEEMQNSRESFHCVGCSFDLSDELPETEEHGPNARKFLGFRCSRCDRLNP